MLKEDFTWKVSKFEQVKTWLKQHNPTEFANSLREAKKTWIYGSYPGSVPNLNIFIRGFLITPKTKGKLTWREKPKKKKMKMDYWYFWTAWGRTKSFSLVQRANVTPLNDVRVGPMRVCLLYLPGFT